MPCLPYELVEPGLEQPLAVTFHVLPRPPVDLATPLAMDSPPPLPSAPSPLARFLAQARPIMVALIAIVMPIVSALVYPTYIHHMLSPQAEFSRLIELPFVVSEVAVVLWAGRQGFDLSSAWRALPRDIRIAAGVLLLAIGVSALLISNNFAYSLTHSLIVLIHLVFALAVYHLLARRSIGLPGARLDDDHETSELNILD